MIEIPQSVLTQKEELYELLEKYPQSIPVMEVANFLGCTVESVRRMVQQGQINGAASWETNGRHGFNINTLGFFLHIVPLVNTLDKPA